MFEQTPILWNVAAYVDPDSYVDPFHPPVPDLIFEQVLIVVTSGTDSHALFLHRCDERGAIQETLLRATVIEITVAAFGLAVSGQLVRPAPMHAEQGQPIVFQPTMGELILLARPA